MNKSFDDKIKEALLEGTKEAEELKGKVFINIQASIQEERKGRQMAKRERRKSLIPRIVAIASVFIILFITSTEFGQATINRIKTFFEPEKKVVEHIEGTEEEKEYTLEKGEMGYIIYIDQSMYEKQVVDGKDRIVPLFSLDGYPDMYMEISQDIELKPEEVAAQIEEDLRKEFPEVENLGEVDDPLEAIHLKAKSGIKHDSILQRYYLVDNTRGGTFIIKMEYTLEAAEGHGARFYHMLKEFQVVDLEDM